MSKGNTFENDILKKVFFDTALSWDAITEIWVSLHTADPGEGGDQTTNEATYGSYARQSTDRVEGLLGWDISGNQASNSFLITFPACTSGSNTITHVGVGTASSGAGQLLYSGALSASLAVSYPMAPSFPENTLIITED